MYESNYFSRRKESDPQLHGETAWEKFNRLWDEHGKGSAISWLRAHFPDAAPAMIARKTTLWDM